MIEAGQSGAGGWNAGQLALLGVEWPPRHGWFKRAIGQPIELAAYEEFLRLRKEQGRKGARAAMRWSQQTRAAEDFANRLYVDEREAFE